MGKLIWCGLALALGLQAQSPIVITVSNPDGSSPTIIPGDIGYVLGFNLGGAGNTSVTVGGVEARVLDAANGRIRVEFPPGLPAGPATLQVTVDGRISRPVTVMVSARARNPVRRGEGSMSAGPPAGWTPANLSGAPITEPVIEKAPRVQAASSGPMYTCDATVTAVSATACTKLNTTIASLYTTTFGNVGAQIYVTLGVTGLGHSSYALVPEDYGVFRALLVANEAGANDTTAVNDSVPEASPYGADQVNLTNATARALGISATFGLETDGKTFCQLGSAGCYDGVITVNNSAPLYFRSGSITASQFDFFTVVEHETDEILGTASCAFGNCGPSAIQPADLFRYHSNKNRSFGGGSNDPCSASDSTNACFSIDGINMLHQYNNVLNGEDAGDWTGTCATQLVQNAALCAGVAGVDISAAEILVLDVIGYTLNNAGAVTNVASSTANGIYGVGASISIQVTFNEIITVTGAPQLALNSGGSAGYSSGSGTNTLTFTYVVEAGQNSTLLDYSSVNALALNGGTIAGPGNTPSLVLAAPGAAGSLSSNSNIVINTSTGQVTFHTNPFGLQFSVDGGTAQTAPQTLTLSQGPHTIAVTTPQAGSAGKQFVFDSWSDNLAISHSITVGAPPATYTASFKTQYQLTIAASPAAGGTVTPATGSFYDSGTVVTVGATANAGYTFAAWSGSVANANSATTTVTMSGPQAVTANFLKPQLGVLLSHSGAFFQGEPSATYTATVSNAVGAGSTSGMVTLTEIPPAGLTLVSMNGGANWTCPMGTNTCFRNDSLNAGASYAAVLITVNVTSTAPAQLTNQVTVSGGQSAGAAGTDPTAIGTSPCDLTADRVTDVSDVQRMIGEVLGGVNPANDLTHAGVIQITDIQIVMNAVLNLGCAAQ